MFRHFIVGRNMSEFQCFNCKKFIFYYSAFFGIFLNFKNYYKDMNTTISQTISCKKKILPQRYAC